MKIRRQGVGETVRTWVLLGLAACGGGEFQAAAALELGDAGGETPVLGNTGDEHQEEALPKTPDAAADVELEREAAPVCDLTACDCRMVHVALCCNGPCPKGFDGMSCYCGDCRFPTTYDAGRCY